ncbi:ArsC/Spx/MgsR family protein [Lactococcus garvieae]
MDYILSHPELIRMSIIFDESKSHAGFNAEEIRRFISKNYRKLEMR